MLFENITLIMFKLKIVVEIRPLTEHEHRLLNLEMGKCGLCKSFDLGFKYIKKI